MIYSNKAAASGFSRNAVSTAFRNKIVIRILLGFLLTFSATSSFAQTIKTRNNLTQREFSRLSVLERARYFENAILSAAIAEGVDPNLLWTIAYNETRFRPWLRSPAGAEGLMQFIPGTAARYNLVDPYNSAASIRAAARYVRFLSNLFGGKIDSVLAAYNSGEGTVSAYLNGNALQVGRKTINPRRLKTIGGVPPYRETVGYVGRGLITYRWLVARGVFPAQTAVAQFPNVISASVARVGLRDAELTLAPRVLQIVRRSSNAPVAERDSVGQTMFTINSEQPASANENAVKCENCNSNSESELTSNKQIYYDLLTGDRYLIRNQNERTKLIESGQIIVTQANRSVPTTARSTYGGQNAPR